MYSVEMKRMDGVLEIDSIRSKIEEDRGSVFKYSNKELLEKYIYSEQIKKFAVLLMNNKSLLNHQYIHLEYIASGKCGSREDGWQIDYYIYQPTPILLIMSNLSEYKKNDQLLDMLKELLKYKETFIPESCKEERRKTRGVGAGAGGALQKLSSFNTCQIDQLKPKITQFHSRLQLGLAEQAIAAEDMEKAFKHFNSSKIF